MSMILHCGGETVTYEQIAGSEPINVTDKNPQGLLVKAPVATSSYTPVAHDALVEMVRESVQKLMGLPEKSQQYGLNRDGKQLFFAITYDTGDSDHGYTVAGRNSYDKSMSAGLVGGTRVFICDNMALSGNSFQVMRKHTTNVWRDLIPMTEKAIVSAGDAYKRIAEQWEVMKEIPVTEDRGAEILGRALYYDALKPQQATRGMRAWGNEFRAGEGKVDPRYVQHGSKDGNGEQSFYTLYQSFTEAAKQGSIQKLIDTHIGVHDFMVAEADRYLGTTGKRLISFASTEGLEID